MFAKHLPLALFFSATALPVLAITDAEITPTALLGKTLTFTIENGGSPYATTGTWSGTFAAASNGFAAKRLTGDFVDVTTTYTSTLDGTFTSFKLAKFVNGHNEANLTLYTVDGVGHYEAFIDGVNGVSLNGTFVFGAPILNEADIAIQQPVGSNLIDGRSKKSFGTVKIGNKGAAKTFIIKNTGTKALTGISPTLSGKASANFTVTRSGKTKLPPGASTTFKVWFSPTSKGTKLATISIRSNDADESPFDIKISGAGAR